MGRIKNKLMELEEDGIIIFDPGTHNWVYTKALPDIRPFDLTEYLFDLNTKRINQARMVNIMSKTWYLLGTSGNYHFWFRNPYNNEKMMIYQVTSSNTTPVGEAGYYNLQSLMKHKDVTYIIPAGADPGVF